MPLFSERNGYVQKPIQVESISKELKNRIWNTYYSGIVVSDGVLVVSTNHLEGIMDECGLPFKTIHTEFDVNRNLSVLRKWFDHAEWYKIYDFIEIFLSYLSAQEKKAARHDFNVLLQAENAGYRVMRDFVVPITNQTELSCLDQAQKTPFNNVNIHFKKATELFSRRPNPDYENSIKESICAVEAMCCVITGQSGKQATLGKTIKQIKDHGVVIHPAMENAFSSLYGYTSDEDGIRHGGMDFSDAPFEDAKYMLVSCSAFVNYLIDKWNCIK